jgi:hypothetical protein
LRYHRSRRKPSYLLGHCGADPYAAAGRSGVISLILRRNGMRRYATRKLVNSAFFGACVLLSSTDSAFAAKPALVATYEDLNPFSKRLDIILDPSSGGFSGNGTFVVPAGMLLVIDYISASLSVGVGGAAVFDVATVYAGNEVESHLPLIAQGTVLGQTYFALSAPTRIYADPGSTVTIAILATASSNGSIVGVYGHYVPTVP